MVLEGALEAGDRARHVASRGHQQAPAASGSRDHGGTVEATRAALEPIEDQLRLGKLAECDQRLDVVRNESRRSRLAHTPLLESLDEWAKDAMRGLVILERQFEQAKRRRRQDGCDHHPSLVGELENGRGVRPRTVDLPSRRTPEGTQAEREQPLWLLSDLVRHLDPLLCGLQCRSPIPVQELGHAELREDPREGAVLGALFGMLADTSQQDQGISKSICR